MLTVSNVKDKSSGSRQAALPELKWYLSGDSVFFVTMNEYFFQIPRWKSLRHGALLCLRVSVPPSTREKTWLNGFVHFYGLGLPSDEDSWQYMRTSSIPQN